MQRCATPFQRCPLVQFGDYTDWNTSVNQYVTSILPREIIAHLLPPRESSTDHIYEYRYISPIRLRIEGGSHDDIRPSSESPSADAAREPRRVSTELILTEIAAPGHDSPGPESLLP